MDSSIKSLDAGRSQGSPSNPAVTILMQGRVRLQKQVEELDTALARTKSIREGSLNPNFGAESVNGRVVVTPGQWSRLTLPQAFRAYAGERGGGPFDIKQVLQDLTLAGVKVVMTRSRFQKNKERPMDLRDVRLLGSNNPVLYDYDRTNDTLRLRSVMEAADLRKTAYKRDRKFKQQKATA